MDCVFCGEYVVDDRYGECGRCNKAFHMYGRDGRGMSKCGEEGADDDGGNLCRGCLEKKERLEETEVPS